MILIVIIENKVNKEKIIKESLEILISFCKTFRQIKFWRYGITRNHVKTFDFLRIVHLESNQLRQNVASTYVTPWTGRIKLSSYISPQ